MRLVAHIERCDDQPFGLDQTMVRRKVRHRRDDIPTFALELARRGPANAGRDTRDENGLR